MRKTIVLFLLLLIFSACGSSAEKFVRIGSVRFCGLSRFTEHSTKMLEKIDPSYKVYPLMLSIALSMNPQFASFDFSQPAAAYYFRNNDKNSLQPLWCISVRRA